MVSSDEGRSLASSWKVQFVETSAMDLKVKKIFSSTPKNKILKKKAVREIFEKSIKAMDNVDTIENGITETAINSNLNNPSRSSNPSINKNSKPGDKSTKQPSSNKICSIS